VALTEVGRMLEWRRGDPELFTDGAYVPLPVDGPHANRVIAFARRHEERTLMVIAPRLVWPLLRDEELPLPRGWGTTRVVIPEEVGPGSFIDVLTGRDRSVGAGGALALEQCLAELPVAVLSGA
jgi:(1->4)-alpha-D-glucan 1-alpha-D-glucosylmutase